MGVQWFVSASQNKVRIFNLRARTGELTEVITLENPLGRTRNREMQRHRQGVTMVRGKGYSGTPHGYSKRQDPHEMAALEFARKVNSYLDAERNRHLYDHLIIAAEPGFLGKIRKTMKRPMQNCVSEWLPKDLAKYTPSRLEKYLSDMVI